MSNLLRIVAEAHRIMEKTRQIEERVKALESEADEACENNKKRVEGAEGQAIGDLVFNEEEKNDLVEHLGVDSINNSGIVFSLAQHNYISEEDTILLNKRLAFRMAR